jgi:hypothetical protein
VDASGSRVLTVPGAPIRHGVELEAVANEPISEPSRNFILETLDPRVPELDHLARLEVDEVVVMPLGGPPVAGMAVTEFATLDDALLLEPLHGPVDRREGDIPAPHGHAPVQLEDVRVVNRLGENLGDQAPLARQFHASGPTLRCDAVRPRSGREPLRVTGSRTRSASAADLVVRCCGAGLPGPIGIGSQPCLP